MEEKGEEWLNLDVFVNVELMGFSDDWVQVVKGSKEDHF